MVALFQFLILTVMVQKHLCAELSNTTVSFVARRQRAPVPPGIELDSQENPDRDKEPSQDPKLYKPLEPVKEKYQGGSDPEVVLKTARPRPITESDCDNILVNCMRAYVTDSLCARTIFYNYQTFPNYCRMDYTNCVMKYEVWQILHMGDCYQYVRMDHYSLSVSFYCDACALCGKLDKVVRTQGSEVQPSNPIRSPRPARRFAATKYTTLPIGPETAPVTYQFYVESEEEETTPHLRMKTRVPGETFMQPCEVKATYCMVAYMTGKVCGRSVYNTIHEYRNWCQMDFVNCSEGYEVWQIAYMGKCIRSPAVSDFTHYEYQDDLFLDQIYVLQE